MKKILYNNLNILIPTISFIILFGWTLSFPYEGPILYAYADQLGFDIQQVNLATVISHAVGLITAQFLSKEVKRAKLVVLVTMCLALIFASLIPFIHTDSYVVIIPFVSFLSGIGIATHGRFIKGLIPDDKRIKYVMLILVVGNVLLIVSDLLASNLDPVFGFAFIQIMLFFAIVGVYKLPIVDGLAGTNEVKEYVAISEYKLLLAFILVITINSGIMFQVIYPYFRSNTFITSLYTNVPYIVAIIILWRIKSNKHYFLYIGAFLWAVTFLLFAFVKDTPIAFLAVVTPMLFASGIFDMFWWSVMAKNVEKVKNPVVLVGAVLGVNVFGVWLGGILGNVLESSGASHGLISLVGLGVVILAMLLIMPLNISLVRNTRYSDFLLDEKYFMNLHTSENQAHKMDLNRPKNTLSSREYEIFLLLMKGEKNQEISEELFVTINTVKTHNRNIYKKLEVTNKHELIEMFVMK